MNDPNDLTGMTAVLYCTVPYITARVDVSWNGIFWNHSVLLPPTNEVWGKVIFSVACVKNSVHRGGVPGQVHPQAGTPSPGRYTPSPRAVHAGKYGQQAGGTHPTGMHSCFMLICDRWRHYTQNT